MDTATDWYIYLIRCKDGSLYTGITTNVSRRFSQHQNTGIGAKYLRSRRPLTLVFKRKVGNRSLAMSVEHAIKKLSKERKEELIINRKHIQEIIKKAKKLLS